MPILRPVYGVVLFVFWILACASLSDEETYKRAAGISSVEARAEAMQAYISDFPLGDNVGRAYGRLFHDHLALNMDRQALQFAQKYLEQYPENARLARYNEVAWALAEKKVGLDSAEQYAERAVKLARADNPGRLSMILDTYAYVIFQNGDAKRAEQIQLEALPGHEKDPGYLFRLAQYQYGAEKQIAAINTMLHCMLLGGDDSGFYLLEDWLDKGQKAEAWNSDFVSELVNKRINDFLTEEDEPLRRSRAAIILAKTGVDIMRAEAWAGMVLETEGVNAQPGDLVQYSKNLAAIFGVKKEYQKIIDLLQPLSEVAPPYDQEFWLLLGSAQRSLGKEKEAANTLVSGLTWRKYDKLLAELKTLISDEIEIDKLIEARKHELLSFNPGHNKEYETGSKQVILTELFTGAECAPCVGADLALDLLAEYYNRKTVALLEYHLHIPGPDPLTNNDSEERYKFYGSNFGTPTVFINGRDKYSGGGPALVKKNAFYKYNSGIRKYLPGNEIVKIECGGKRNGNLIDIDINVSNATRKNVSANLHIALVERHVNYIGRNGISRHAFVVRSLEGGASGIPLTYNNGKAEISRKIELQEVEADLKKYLDNFQADPPQRFRGFTGWKSRPQILDRDNLAVVAWLQDTESKDVLQAVYTDL